MEKELSVLSTKIASLHDDIVDIKAAMKSLSEAITKLALVEARQVQSDAAIERAFKAIEKVEVRLERAAIQAERSKQASDWVYRAVWAAAAAMGVYALKVLKVI